MSDNLDCPDLEGQVTVARKLAEPVRYRVLLHNDDHTTMNFVVQVLCSVFHKTMEAATTIMLNVHKNGVGECGIYTQEVAEAKVDRVKSLSRAAGFPLKCTMEKV